jgi:hypothetical protein
LAFEDRVPAAQRGPGKLALALGDETPVMSPALDMQRALDEMLNTAAGPSVDYGRGLMLTATLLAAAGVCSAFWWATVKWAVTLLA